MRRSHDARRLAEKLRNHLSRLRSLRSKKYAGPAGPILNCDEELLHDAEKVVEQTAGNIAVMSTTIYNRLQGRFCFINDRGVRMSKHENEMMVFQDESAKRMLTQDREGAIWEQRTCFASFMPKTASCSHLYELLQIFPIDIKKRRCENGYLREE